jgi:hypothetical protein
MKKNEKKKTGYLKKRIRLKKKENRDGPDDLKKNRSRITEKNRDGRGWKACSREKNEKKNGQREVYGLSKPVSGGIGVCRGLVGRGRGSGTK